MFFFNDLKVRSGRPVACGISSLLVVAGIAVAADGPLVPRSPGPATFIDLVDHPAPEANWDRFYALEDHLAGAFHKACGEGACLPRRFLWPMQLRCSVRVADATVAACIWVIAGSDLQVRAAGSIDPDVVVWRCVLPVGDAVAVDAFHAALEADDPLAARLPGAAESLRQGVARCLAKQGAAS
ncbi:hypothetical protein H9654_05835 [Stenotrophomonas sp. Sa5BUN4]|uniref:Uncharacterized protein n=1 Tax=Stenotrophomonas lacuserhaii TaxID=2760084 RepID=A0A8X8FVM5_9GAMM|nr:hypothetical protein [Stenotrophomonas pennii]MBD7953727.1 hypothetical protein [Stenotrophomonas pennii]